MKNKFYMKEFLHFNGEDFVTFNILDVDELKHEFALLLLRQVRFQLPLIPY